MGLEEYLLPAAKVVDKFDRITGPVSMILQYSGNETLESLGSLMNLTEIYALKVPFMIATAATIKDYVGIGCIYAPKEILGNAFPLFRLIDIFPTYVYRTRNRMRKV